VVVGGLLIISNLPWSIWLSFVLCRRFGYLPLILSPFGVVAVLTFAVLVCRRFDQAPLKGRCHGNQLKLQSGVFRGRISLSCCHSEMDWNVRTPMGSSEVHWMWLHRIQVWWCLVQYVSEKRLLIFVLLRKNWKNEHIRLIISENALPISTNYSALIDIWVGIINLTFVLRSLKGRCYGNQLIWGTFCKRRIWLPPIFALVFWNGMH